MSCTCSTSALSKANSSTIAMIKSSSCVVRLRIRSQRISVHQALRLATIRQKAREDAKFIMDGLIKYDLLEAKGGQSDHK